MILTLNKYEIHVNGCTMFQIYAPKSPRKLAQTQTGDLFGKRKVEIINCDTGEIETII